MSDNRPDGQDMSADPGGLEQYAERELRLAGLFDADSDYDGMLGPAVMDLVRVFSAQGHSGMSAHIVTSMLTKLLQYEPLTPLTYSADEWFLHRGHGKNGGDLWQNVRDSRVFSDDGGKTHWQVK